MEVSLMLHCTAGLGRAPAAVLAYMFRVLGYKLTDAVNLLTRKCPCFPKLDAIKNATADILTGMTKKVVTLTWGGDNCSTVEISGLDFGWDQEGRYEYKYIIDGGWTHNKHEPFTSPNKDGHVSNYVHVVEEDPNTASAAIQKRMTGDDPQLTTEERLKIRQFLESCPSDE